MKKVGKIVATIMLASLAFFGLIGILAGEYVVGGVLAALGIAGIVLLNLKHQSRAKKECIKLQQELDEANGTIAVLSKYQQCVDAEAEASRIRKEAEDSAAAEREAANALKQKAQQTLKDAQDAADQKLIIADAEAKKIIETAHNKAEEIAGDAYAAKEKADEYRKTAEAMRNIVEGYGNQYLKPTYSLLDELAEDFSFTDAGQKLKAAREKTARMVRLGVAATCDYVETGRKTTAIAFVVDAFNGKVDSILSKTKKDNYGTLEQKIKDAYQVVNNNGRAFRNAVITPEYLEARLDELKWACTVSELKARDQEEQRSIRERMREEEKARREFERAQKEAAKEEEMLRKAMAKAEAMLESANEAKRAEYEAKLQDLREKLAEAEEKGQRALSMAQQTKRGNVYVISNIGAFGENVYKVGMTRRLEPMDRIKELGDASVPFPFDVHAIIESDDAPALETQLHQELALTQMNKVNPRKEFFKVPLSSIKALVDAKGLQTNWTMKAEAAEYYETLAIEKTLKEDPKARAEWEAFASSVAEENTPETAEV